MKEGHVRLQRAAASVLGLALAAGRAKAGAEARIEVIAIQLDLTKLHLQLIHLRQHGELAGPILLEVCVGMGISRHAGAQGRGGQTAQRVQSI